MAVLIHVQEKEADQLEEQLRLAKADLAKAKQTLERNMVNQQYLEGVVEYSDEFQEIEDILKRYDTLVATKQAHPPPRRHPYAAGPFNEYQVVQ